MWLWGDFLGLRRGWGSAAGDEHEDGQDSETPTQGRKDGPGRWQLSEGSHETTGLLADSNTTILYTKRRGKVKKVVIPATSPPSGFKLPYCMGSLEFAQGFFFLGLEAIRANATLPGAATNS